jgi:hypothetical protein
VLLSLKINGPVSHSLDVRSVSRKLTFWNRALSEKSRTPPELRSENENGD